MVVLIPVWWPGVGARHPFNKPDTWSGLSVACDLDTYNNGINTRTYSKPEREKTETGRSKLRAVQRQISEKIGEKINYYENNTNSSGTKRKRKLSRPNRSVRSIEATEFENNISYENLTCIKERDQHSHTTTNFVWAVVKNKELLVLIVK